MFVHKWIAALMKKIDFWLFEQRNARTARLKWGRQRGKAKKMQTKIDSVAVSRQLSRVSADMVTW